MILDSLISIVLYSIFGLIGIYAVGKNKYLKKNLTKQNLIFISIVFIILNAVLMKNLDGNTGLSDGLIYSFGNFIATFMGAILAIGIKTKFKKFFVKEFYFALFGSIILGSTLLILAFGWT